MERIAKMLVVLSLVVVVMTMEVDGGRSIKSDEDQVKHPNNFIGRFSGTFPSPITGTIQSPGFSASFPSPGLGFNPSSFCSFPGVTCTPVQPTNTFTSP